MILKAPLSTSLWTPVPRLLPDSWILTVVVWLLKGNSSNLGTIRYINPFHCWRPRSRHMTIKNKSLKPWGYVMATRLLFSTFSITSHLREATLQLLRKTLRKLVKLWRTNSVPGRLSRKEHVHDFIISPRGTLKELSQLLQTQTSSVVVPAYSKHSRQFPMLVRKGGEAFRKLF